MGGKPAAPFVGYLGAMITKAASGADNVDIAREFIENHMLSQKGLETMNADAVGVVTYQDLGDRIVGSLVRQLEEFRVDAAILTAAERYVVTGTTKGRGFQGVVHRHGFHGGPASHGNTRHRKPGSIGPGTDPSRVIKGKKMPGHHGAERHTEMGLTIVRVDAERNLLFVRGAVPGSKNGIVTVAKQGGKSRHD